jgi:hypothetical protein
VQLSKLLPPHQHVPFVALCSVQKPVPDQYQKFPVVWQSVAAAEPALDVARALAAAYPGIKAWQELRPYPLDGLDTFVNPVQ